MPNKNSDVSAKRQAVDEAQALAFKLVETCQPYRADPYAVISALSVTLGMVISYVEASPDVVDVAIETIHGSIAAHTHRGALQ